MSISRILVVGAGQMGAGIAQVAAQAEIAVTLTDISVDYARRGLDRISKALSRLVDKGRLTTEQKDSILSRIVVAPDLEAAARGADLVDGLRGDLLRDAGLDLRLARGDLALSLIHI